MIGWKSPLGRAAALVVRAVARAGSTPRRPLTEAERSILEPVFQGALDYQAMWFREGVRGLLNVSARAFVIENTVFLPRDYLPLPPALLVHEATHVWQFQHGGHAYIADSLHAQFLGDGYDLEKALIQKRAWGALNCEQQATLLEEAYAQGCFRGRPFIVRGRDYTGTFEYAVQEVRAGRGAGFRSPGQARR
ncbi:MAG: hypothetical protein AMXMBFR34_25950 [Myxococcaceae bacterium]